MGKRAYELTGQQKRLLSGMQRVTKEQGLETQIIECPWHEPTHTNVLSFLKLLDKAEKSARKSTLIFVGNYQNSYAQQNLAYAF